MLIIKVRENGHKRSLVFNKINIQKIKTNYSPIEEIKIIYNTTINTFNTFWKGILRNDNYLGKLKSNIITKNEQELDVSEGNNDNNNEYDQNVSTILLKRSL